MNKKLFFLFLTASSLQAELLIMQQKPDGTFGPLNDADAVLYNDQIAEIMMKYQWPMVISSELTPQERAQLLAAERPNAEELFIQKKLQEALPALNLHVVFIPTTIYEMFVISQLNVLLKPAEDDWALEKNDLKTIVTTTLNLAFLLNPNFKHAKFCLNQKITNKEANQFYIQNNSVYYTKPNPNQKSLFLIFNTLLIQHLTALYPDFTQQKSAAELSMFIENKCIHISNDVAKTLNTTLRSGYPPYFEKTEIINQVINLEYKARSLNKATLIRGTKLIEVKSQNQVNSLLLAADIIRTTSENQKYNIYPISSISFGSSLLAGFFNDPDACALVFLFNINQESPQHAEIGYALLINKLRYNDFLFIPGLSTLAGLLQKGECFHPRTKIPKQYTSLKGIYLDKNKELSDILLTNSSPFWFAKNFSNFVATHAEFIYQSDKKQSTDSLLKNQSELAKHYQNLSAKNLTQPWIQRAKKRIKSKQSSLDDTPTTENILSPTTSFTLPDFDILQTEQSSLSKLKQLLIEEEITRVQLLGDEATEFLDIQDALFDSEM